MSTPKASTLLRLRRILNLITVREQVLLLVFVWALLIWWASSVFGGYRGFFGEFRFTSNRLEAQQLYLDQSAIIVEDFAAARARVDPSRTYDGNQLSERLDSMIRQAGITASIGSAESDDRGLFTYYTSEVDVRRAELGDLERFDQLLKKESPYIGLDRITVSSIRTDPRTLRSRYELSSFELRDNLDTP